MRIRIVSWEKFNPRKDVKHSSWLRLENNFFSNPKFYKCSTETKLVWIYLLCEASQKQSGEITICPDLISALTKISPSKIESALIDLMANDQIIDVTRMTRARNEDDTDAIGKLSYTIPTDERTNERTNDSSQTGNQFDALNPQELARLWNYHKSQNQSAVKISSIKSGTPRHKHAKARIAEEPDRDYWIAVIKKIAASPFCNGSNDRGWKAGFDFLVKPDKHHKAMEGDYDQHQAGGVIQYARPEDIA